MSPLIARAICSRRISTASDIAEVVPFLHAPALFPGRGPPDAFAPVGCTDPKILPALGLSLRLERSSILRSLLELRSLLSGPIEFGLAEAVCEMAVSLSGVVGRDPGGAQA